MLIKAETKEKKEKISWLHHEKYKGFFKTDDKLIKGSLVNMENQLFNNISLNKYEAYKLINKAEDLSAYVPHTQKAKSYRQIIKFTRKYEKVILRPINFCINAPIYFLEVIDNYIKITDNTKSQSEKKIIQSDSELKEQLLLNKVSLDNYFIQKGIKFDNLGELPYDIRIGMKKYSGVNWKCSSLQFIVGQNKILLNKMSDKLEGIYLKSVLKKSLPVGCKQDVLIKQINIICHKACIMLEQRSPHLYEYEFDIAIDKEKKLWITDINFFNSYKGFKQIDFKTYFSRKFAPILYSTLNNNLKYK